MKFGGNGGVFDVFGWVVGKFGVFFVGVFVVWGVVVVNYGYDVGEYDVGVVVFVCVEKDIEIFKFVGGVKDGVYFVVFLCELYGEFVVVELVFVVDFEFYFDFLVCGG